MASRVIPPLASYADKPSTATQLRFTAWLREQTGIDVRRMTPDQAFERGVALSLVLRPSFQQSPENQAYLDARRKERREEMAARQERREERDSADADIAAQVPEPSILREPDTASAPPARRRPKSRTSRAAAKAAEDRPAGPDPAPPAPADEPFEDPFADDEPAGTPEDPIVPADVDPSDPPGSLWLGGPKAAAKGEPANGGRGVMRPAPW